MHIAHLLEQAVVVLTGHHPLVDGEVVAHVKAGPRVCGAGRLPLLTLDAPADALCQPA